MTASPRIFCVITQRLQCRAELRLYYNLMNIQVATYFSFQHPSYHSASVFFHLSNLCCTKSSFRVTSHHSSPLHIAVPFGVIMQCTGCEYSLQASNNCFCCNVFWSTIIFFSSACIPNVIVYNSRCKKRLIRYALAVLCAVLCSHVICFLVYVTNREHVNREFDCVFYTQRGIWNFILSISP